MTRPPFLYTSLFLLTATVAALGWESWELMVNGVNLSQHLPFIFPAYFFFWLVVVLCASRFETAR
jgi:hypothetical protein